MLSPFKRADATHKEDYEHHLVNFHLKDKSSRRYKYISSLLKNNFLLPYKVLWILFSLFGIR